MPEKNKNKFLVDDGAAIGAAVGAGVGVSNLLVDDKVDLYNKRGRKIKGKVKPTVAQRDAFIKKLKPGDVLISGDYKPGLKGKIYDSLLGGKDGYWHAAVYKGNGELVEIGNKSRGKNVDSIKRRLKKGERIKALRPNFDGEKLVSEVSKRTKGTRYSNVGAGTAFIRNKMGIKGSLGNCKGDFCSNVIAKSLPEKSKKVMRVNPDIAMPSDFAKHPHFKQVAEMNLARTEKLTSKARLLRNVSRPVATGVVAGGLLGAAATLFSDKK